VNQQAHEEPGQVEEGVTAAIPTGDHPPPPPPPPPLPAAAAAPPAASNAGGDRGDGASPVPAPKLLVVHTVPAHATAAFMPPTIGYSAPLGIFNR
jgi:hypothetical protein